MVAPTPPYGQFYADITDSTVQVGGNPVSVGTLLTSGEYAFQIGPATLGVEAPQWGQVFAGNNAAWNMVASGRAFNTTYTNSFGKPISVSVQGQAITSGYYQLLNFLVNGNLIGSSNQTQAISGAYMSGNFIVPTGDTYEVQWINGSAEPYLDYWNELY